VARVFGTHRQARTDGWQRNSSPRLGRVQNLEQSVGNRDRRRDLLVVNIELVVEHALAGENRLVITGEGKALVEVDLAVLWQHRRDYLMVDFETRGFEDPFNAITRPSCASGGIDGCWRGPPGGHVKHEYAEFGGGMDGNCAEHDVARTDCEIGDRNLGSAIPFEPRVRLARKRAGILLGPCLENVRRAAAKAVLSTLCVPITSSTSCHQAVFVDQAADPSLSSDAVQVEVDRFG
jgi:hypothetical protein